MRDTGPNKTLYSLSYTYAQLSVIEKRMTKRIAPEQRLSSSLVNATIQVITARKAETSEHRIHGSSSCDTRNQIFSSEFSGIVTALSIPHLIASWLYAFSKMACSTKKASHNFAFLLRSLNISHLCANPKVIRRPMIVRTKHITDIVLAVISWVGT